MEIVWASYRSAEEGRKVVVCDIEVAPEPGEAIDI